MKTLLFSQVPCLSAALWSGRALGPRGAPWLLGSVIAGALLAAPDAGAAKVKEEPPRFVRVTLLSAQLGKLKAKPHVHSSASPDLVACLTQPLLRERVGACDKAPPQDGPELNPQVRLELPSPGAATRRVESFAVPRTNTPRWDYTVVLDVAQVTRGKFVDLALFDQHDSGELLLAGKRLQARELLKPGTRKLKLGAAELSYRVEPAGEPRRYHFLVPVGDPEALLRTAEVKDASTPVYQLIPVAEGEQLTVSVKPQLKTRRPPRPVAAAPPTKPAPPSSKGAAAVISKPPAPAARPAAPVDECLGCSRAILRGAIGAARFPVAPEQLTARAGLLALSVADLPVGGAAPIYEGGLEVELMVGPPPTQPVVASAGVTEAPKGRGARRGRAEGSAGGNAAPIERVIDAHDAEIQACVAEAPDPSGEVVLLFSIASDGAPMGVLVERCTPNLQKAGECIRRKALKWRFPASNGVVTARYPMKFSTQ